MLQTNIGRHIVAVTRKPATTIAAAYWLATNDNGKAQRISVHDPLLDRCANDYDRAAAVALHCFPPPAGNVAVVVRLPALALHFVVTFLEDTPK